MKYFRIFNNHSDYEKFRESDDYIVTNVSVCLEEGDVHISEPKSEDYSDKYLTFVAVEPSTFSFTSNEIEYSLDDGSTWSTLLVGSSTEEVGAGEKINFRANITSAGTVDVGIGTFSSTGKFDVEGNIMSLIYGDDFIDKTTAKTRNFERMFYQNENIINAENLVLPVEQMPSYCYREMFDSCTNLESAPILSATTLEQYCYSSMFRGCTKLENTQEELPSTELPTCCYVKMYAGCSSLKEMPKIKGIHASWSSCESMFSACTSLSAVTEFDVETTTKLTCSEMFEDCTSLTIVPDLKIKTITGQTSGSLNAMFKNCTSLVNAPKIPSDLSITSPVGGTNVSGEFKQMFMGCTSLKTAPDLPNTRLSDGGYQSMFAGCTSLENAPILPSTALASACYEGMFSGCTSLTTAPLLPSTTLANNCYNSMFRDCTSLTTAPSLPSTTLAEGVYQSMFEGCTSLAIAPELPATTLYNDCYRAMFTGCTSLTVAPVLSAQTLVGNCYRYMFGGCNKLNYIEALFTNTPSTSYTYNWVNGVARSGTFVMSANAEWDTGTTACGVHKYPCNWTVTTHASVHVTGVTLDTTASTINKGATTTLVATVSPNDATDKSVSWSTSDASIATVDSSGAVSGVGCGNATITVTTVDGGYTATCDVSVENHVTSVDIDAYQLYLNSGGTYQFEVTVLPVDACNTAVTWSSSDSNIVSVDNNGLVSAITTGDAVVTVTTVDSGLTKNCSITVNEGEHVTGVTLSDAAITINKDETYTLTATVLPNDAIDKSVTWSTSDASVATVDSNGVVSGVASGDAVITVTTVDGGYTAQCSVSVSEEHDYSKDYFTIESLEDNNDIKIQKVNGTNFTIYYSIDGGETWSGVTNTSAGATISVINNGEKILLKGNVSAYATAWNAYNHFIGTKQFKVYGNAMSLINGSGFTENSEFDDTKTNHFTGLFKGSTNLVDASNLILPAQTLYTNSYNGMFRDATALQHGPKMLAITPTGTECCASMFEGCINLEEPIEINFTTLSQQCCWRMFCMNRNSKITTPKMTKSPILKCNTSALDCYREMFEGNGNLNEITCLLEAPGGTTNWVQYAGDATGTFYKNPNASWGQGGTGNVPSGWDIVNYVEE